MEGKGAKKKRKFDFTTCHRRFVALKVAYLGWDYMGFADQGETLKTIESEMFKVGRSE